MMGPLGHNDARSDTPNLTRNMGIHQDEQAHNCTLDLSQLTLPTRSPNKMRILRARLGFRAGKLMGFDVDV